MSACSRFVDSPTKDLLLVQHLEKNNRRDPSQGGPASHARTTGKRLVRRKGRVGRPILGGSLFHRVLLQCDIPCHANAIPARANARGS